MSDLALLHREGRVATLTLNRPDARNALSLDLLAALHTRIDEVAATPDLAALVITGAGKSFCAGMDLRAVLDEPGAPARLLSSIAELTLKLRALPCITIARVNGAAIGGGCGVMCVADFAITHPESKIGFPEVDLGVCPAVVAPWLILRVGAGRARRILLEGGVMSGQRAFDAGLVTTLAAESQLDDAVSTLTSRLAAAAPGALRATKEMLNRLDGPGHAAAVRRGAELSAEVVTSDEARQSLRAAFSKPSR